MYDLLCNLDTLAGVQCYTLAEYEASIHWMLGTTALLIIAIWLFVRSERIEQEACIALQQYNHLHAESSTHYEEFHQLLLDASEAVTRLTEERNALQARLLEIDPDDVP